MNMRDAYRMLGIVALILVIAFALQLATLPPAGIALVLVVVAVVFAVLFASRRRARAQARPTSDVRVRTLTAPTGEEVRVLESGGVYQSATYVGERRFEPVFAYQRAFEVLFDADGPMRAACGHGIERALALGGGGFAWPKYTLLRHKDLALDVVERDPDVIEAARRWFYLTTSLRASTGACRLWRSTAVSSSTSSPTVWKTPRRPWPCTAAHPTMPS